MKKVYTKEESDIKIHWYGAHIFHTDNEEVWHYINRFAKFNNYVNSPLAYSEGRLYNLPFNMNTFNKLWNVNTPEEAKHKIQEQCSKYKDISQPANLEEQALKLCGDDIYYTFISILMMEAGSWLAGRPHCFSVYSLIKV